jgi:hypothetical protein
VSTGVTGDGDAVDFAAASLFEAGGNGSRWKPRPVFDAIQAFFFDSGDQLTSFEKGGGGIAMKCVKAENIHEYVE